MQICGYDVFSTRLFSFRVMIQYHITILLLPLSSLIITPYQIFAYVARMILPMILLLVLVGLSLFT
jgi:hypothetical protein